MRHDKNINQTEKNVKNWRWCNFVKETPGIGISKTCINILFKFKLVILLLERISTVKNLKLKVWFKIEFNEKSKYYWFLN